MGEAMGCKFCGKTKEDCTGSGYDDGIEAHDYTPRGPSNTPRVELKEIGQLHNDRVELAVYECPCGFHIGFDVSYLEQVGPCEITCPSCGLRIFAEEAE